MNPYVRADFYSTGMNTVKTEAYTGTIVKKEYLTMEKRLNASASSATSQHVLGKFC